MGQVSIVINDKSYRIACDDGQEQHLERLARIVDERVANLVTAVGQIGDTRLLVMASLLVADELTDTQTDLEQLKRHVAAMPKASTQAVSSEADELIADTLEHLAGQIEALASKMETAGSA